jgi:hypothetical protein
MTLCLARRDDGATPGLAIPRFFRRAVMPELRKFELDALNYPCVEG